MKRLGTPKTLGGSRLKCLGDPKPSWGSRLKGLEDRPQNSPEKATGSQNDKKYPKRTTQATISRARIDPTIFRKMVPAGPNNNKCPKRTTPFGGSCLKGLEDPTPSGEGCRLKTQCSRKGSFKEGTQKNNGGSRLILRQTTPYGVQFFFKQNPPGPSAGFYGFSVN